MSSSDHQCEVSSIDLRRAVDDERYERERAIEDLQREIQRLREEVRSIRTDISQLASDMRCR